MTIAGGRIACISTINVKSKINSARNIVEKREN